MNHSHGLRSSINSFAFFEEARDGFDLKWLDDGTNYPALWQAYMSGGWTGKILSEHPGREKTVKLEVEGRLFVLKHAPAEGRGSFLKHALSGPIYKRRFELIWKAVSLGCDIIPRPYLLAEKPDGFRRCSESYLLIEYLEGETLDDLEGDIPELWIKGLETSLRALHSFGIASGNAHPGNLVKTPSGMKMIDISFKFPMLISQANDIIDSGRKFGTRVPALNFRLRLAVALMRLKRAWGKFKKNRRSRAVSV